MESGRNDIDDRSSQHLEMVLFDGEGRWLGNEVVIKVVSGTSFVALRP